jgi:hypothetical protein
VQVLQRKDLRLISTPVSLFQSVYHHHRRLRQRHKSRAYHARHQTHTHTHISCNSRTGTRSPEELEAAMQFASRLAALRDADPEAFAQLAQLAGGSGGDEKGSSGDGAAAGAAAGGAAEADALLQRLAALQARGGMCVRTAPPPVVTVCSPITPVHVPSSLRQ